MNAFLLFGEELKQHRQTKQFSLAQVSALTRINVKFLEAIEEGRFAILPEPYVRAFVGEFAAAIDLNPDEVLHKYDEATIKAKPSPVPQPIAPPQKPPLFSIALDHQRNIRLVQLARRQMVPLVAVLAITLVVLVLSTAGSGDTPPAVPPEVSFDRVVKESEAVARQHQPVPQPPTARSVEKPDSLRLEITTLDTLWMMVVIDGTRTVEYLFPPNYQQSWTAKQQFAITLGNAGGATFRLNGKELGALGNRGAVIRNAVITAESAMNL